MDLQEEYFQRHTISSSLVLYPDAKYGCNLIARNNSKIKQTKFTVVSITFHKIDNHPGFFKFVQQIPSKDSSMKSFWEKKVEWDEWEKFIVDWAGANKGQLQPLLSKEELAFASWEMFGYSQDTWLAANLVDRHKDDFYSSFDESVAINERIKIINNIESIIKTTNRSVANVLTQLRGFVSEKTYATWLAKLLA